MEKKAKNKNSDKKDFFFQRNVKALKGVDWCLETVFA